MTTVIINRETGGVFTDSRGTEENEISNWRLLPYPRKVVKTERVFSTVQKVFPIGNMIVTGCGSLNILEYFVDVVDSGVARFKNAYYIKSQFEPSNTSVFIVKRSLNKVNVLKLEVTVKRLPFNYYKLCVKKKIMDNKFVVAGSGRQYALGALSMNASELEAIECTTKYDFYTDSRVQCNFV